jgi:hypothetical protein
MGITLLFAGLLQLDALDNHLQLKLSRAVACTSSNTLSTIMACSYIIKYIKFGTYRTYR